MLANSSARLQPAQSAALLHTIIATRCNMRVLAAITLLAGASALVPPQQRRSGVALSTQSRSGAALRAGFGGAATKKTKKFVKPGKASA